MTQEITVSQKGLILRSFEDMQKWAENVKASGLAPASLKTAAQIIVATQYGLELGLTPMAALNSIAVINNKPTLYGDAALALVRRSGLCEYVIEEFDGTTAKCRAKRKDQEAEVVRTFSIEDAKQARLWGKPGPWTTHPKRMLQYKARAFCLRDLFPDVLLGLHLYEEMEGEEETALPAPETTVPRREERRKPVEATVISEQETPPADEDDDNPLPTSVDEYLQEEQNIIEEAFQDETEEEVQPEPLPPRMANPKTVQSAAPAATQAQGLGGNPEMLKFARREIWNMYVDKYNLHNVDQQEVAEKFGMFCSLTLGREIHSSKELTMTDLMTLRKRLERGAING